MGLFKRRAPSKEGVHTDKGLAHLCNRSVKYVTVRKLGENGETVIGRSGYINCVDGRIIICCGSVVPFDRHLEELVVGELMSHNGATFTFVDQADGRKKTVTAYYTSFVK